MKKFSNLYRLMRLGVPASQLPRYLGDPAAGGPYQAAALLLAILISDPGHVRGLLTHLGDLDVDVTADVDVVDALHAADDTRHPSDTGQVPDPAVVRLTDTITELRRTGVVVHGDVVTYQRWARTVARYSFDTYQLYTEPDHTEPDHTDR